MVSPSNIYIIGAQYTGKTTLVNGLEKHLQREENLSTQGNSLLSPCIIKEVARNVLKDHGFTAEDITNSKTRALELQERILEAQWKAEASAVCRSWLISDRSAVDPVTYAAKFVSTDAALKLMKTEIWTELRNRMHKSIVVVCEPGMAWLNDDGVRLMPASTEDWASVHITCCEILNRAEISYCILPNSLVAQERRMSFILERWASASADK